ncbi:hypothetical protein PsYK624_060060 [Phanerochaete sordida]|uniref:BTB domain-containing protein n=1 Tax=Phanerochaete sordida TaxID=48140 RepID=A0A9P3G8R4_9APHY|nr:hypothetical protein PsYK624_060060 [Phanerochaete sordida]
MPASTRSRRSVDDADTPNKRRKVEPAEDEGSALRDVELGDRSEDLWFEDGNVILAAEGMSFRVHKGILTLRSDVFKTLLDDASLERLEGCPVFRVEDKGKDLHDLLYIIYNGGKSDWLNSTRPTIAYHDFRRVVDIALKYNIEDVIREAEYRLSQAFPTDSLASWYSTGNNALSLRFSSLECIDALRISRLLAVNSILPLVFYECCNIAPFMKIVRGVKLDGIPEPIMLSQDDLALCLQGREMLIQESSRIMRVFQELLFAAPSDRCTLQPHCRQALLLLSLSASDAKLYLEPNVLYPMDNWLDEHEAKPDSKPCRHCDATLRERIDTRREEVWSKLGKIFGIAEWPAGGTVSTLFAGYRILVILKPKLHAEKPREFRCEWRMILCGPTASLSDSAGRANFRRELVL